MTNTRFKLAGLAVLVALLAAQLSAQILSGDALKKVIPSAYFFAGQSAAVQTRNSVALKSAGGHFVLAGLVDTSGYSTAIQEKYQGFFKQLKHPVPLKLEKDGEGWRLYAGKNYVAFKAE